MRQPGTREELVCEESSPTQTIVRLDMKGRSRPFAIYPRELGSDPLLVQASNGNTSIKLEGILWIKASGKWLAHATQEEMFVPLELAAVREAIQNGTEISPRYVPKNELRPSIETAMHAILRHRVVIHVHSINTIAWAIRLDGADQLKERLDGLHWQWIPYAASGIRLAREIEKAVAQCTGDRRSHTWESRTGRLWT